MFYYFFRNAATKTIKQELIFVGSEYGKLAALREIIQKVVYSFMTYWKTILQFKYIFIAQSESKKTNVLSGITTNT